MKHTHAIVRLALIMAMLMVAMSMAIQSAAAPGDIHSATLHIYSSPTSGRAVRVHRVTALWTETGVTWGNFGGSFHGSVEDSFQSVTADWVTATVTSLVQGWIHGTYLNYGLLLEQLEQDVPPRFTGYPSREYSGGSHAPWLEICHVISEPCQIVKAVADTYISELDSAVNYGTREELYTRSTAGAEKQTLIRFFELPGEGCTPGYWKNHLDSWDPTDYSPSDDFDTTFGVDLFDPDITLEQAVNAKGGGNNVLARHGTAALLSAAHPDVDYPLMTEIQVIEAVQAGDVDTLVTYNELGCPID